MIIVQIDFLKATSRERELMGLLMIANDGTGGRQVGNYDVFAVNKPLQNKGRQRALYARVHGFPRLQGSVWQLVWESIRAAIADGINIPLDETGEAPVLTEAAMARMGATFKGNPSTNDAARYYAELRRWRDGGMKGPAPEKPESMRSGAIGKPPEEVETEAERKRRLEREQQQAQGRLF